MVAARHNSRQERTELLLRSFAAAQAPKSLTGLGLLERSRRAYTASVLTAKFLDNNKGTG